MARPSEFTPDKAAEICAALVEGKSLRSICAADAMPDIKTVYRWMGANEEFRQQYARAREDQADTLADEIIDIADDSSGDVIEVDGKEVVQTEVIHRSRLRVEARKWVASKLKPKKYGDAMIHKGDASEPIAVNISLG